MLVQFPAARVPGIATGTIDSNNAELAGLLRLLAAETDRVRQQRRFARWLSQFHVGRVSSVEQTYVIIFNASSSWRSLAVPRELARSAHRDRVGDCLAVINSQMHESEVIVRAMPGIDLSSVEEPPFSPFARSGGFERVTEADMAYLRGTPEPLTLHVPITIDQ